MSAHSFSKVEATQKRAPVNHMLSVENIASATFRALKRTEAEKCMLHLSSEHTPLLMSGCYR